MSHMIPMHIGSDHPAAAALTLVLAFGPFIFLGIVVFVLRRRDAQEHEREDQGRSSE